MNKREFLLKLKNALSGLPQEDADERLSFYSEMIDDRTEDGMTEEQAVASLGSITDIVSQTVSSVPISKIIKEKIRPKRPLSVWEITLIVLGFPFWFPLLVSVGAVIISLYVAVWSIIVSLWAAELSLFASALCGLAYVIIYAAKKFGMQAVASAGAAAIISGLSVFAFFWCVSITKGIFRLTTKALISIKTLFLKNKECVQ